MPPDQLGLDGFEERLDGGVIIAISFTTHRRFEVMLAQDFLVIVRAVLAATIGVMDAAFWVLLGRLWPSSMHGSQGRVSSDC